MRTLGLPFLHRSADVGPLLLRIGVGLVFIVYGYSKFDGGPATGIGGMLDGLGVPAPTLFGWLVTIAELGGGILLVLGLLTRLVTVPLIATMIGAMILVKFDLGFMPDMGTGIELDIALLAGLFALLFVGPGSISADRMLGIEGAASRTPDTVRS